MLKITDRAKDKLKEALEIYAPNSDSVIRLVSDSANTNRLQFILTGEEEDDEVITDEEGQKLLVPEPVISEILNNKVLDYEAKPEGNGFVILKPLSRE